MDPQQPEWILDPVQNSEAVDEIKPLLETIERERVHPSIFNGGAEQAMDCAEAFSAPQHDAPPRSDPEAVLLVVDRHHVLGPSPLGKEGVEAVKAADIEHAHPGEVLGKRGHAIAMVTRGAGRIDALSAVQRKGVKPERHRLDSRASESGVNLDRQHVGHLPLSLRHDEPLPRASLRRPRHPATLVAGAGSSALRCTDDLSASTSDTSTRPARGFSSSHTRKREYSRTSLAS